MATHESKIVDNTISTQHFFLIEDRRRLPKLINSNDPESTGKSIKIPEEEALGSTISMYHYKSRRILFTIKSNSVYKSFFTANRAKPPDLGPWWTRAYIDLFLNIRCPEIQAIQPPFQVSQIVTIVGKN